MTEYRNIEKIECILDFGEKMWKCNITRALSDPKIRDSQVCYSIKTEEIKDIDTIETVEEPKVCEVMDSYKGKLLRCK